MRDLARLVTFIDELRRVAKGNPVVEELLGAFFLAVNADEASDRLECQGMYFEADIVRTVPLIYSMVSKDAGEKGRELT